MSNRKINIVELEFDQIKENLKEFLRGQSQFDGYDFEGSNMSVLLDVLAYNTHYNAMYMNMALNESFLDSASRRDSVVSLAKSLGYVPRSSVCAKASISFTVSGVLDNPDTLTAIKNTAFSGTKDNVRYTFYTTEDVTVLRNADFTYQFNNIDVLEGTPITTRYEYTTLNSFTIPNINVDVGTLKIRVQETPTSTLYETFVNAGNLANVDNESAVFFLRETDTGLYEISFGDGVLGKQLATGNVINVEYFVCSGQDPNGISSLIYSGGSFNGGTVSNILLNGLPVNGGRAPETIEEIRFNAPNFYASQNRAVTALDYESILLSKVPSIETIAVWGGENNNPPVYGKVFISAKTVAGRNLTLAEKTVIEEDILEKYKVISVVPEFVDPQFIDLELNVTAYYDSTLTTKTDKTLSSLIISNILVHNNQNLKKFNKIYRQSIVARIVESSDSSIISSVIRTKMYRSVTPIYGVDNVYNINVGNPFTPGTILSSGFYIANNPNICYIDDDGNGNLTLFANLSSGRFDYGVIGSTNYETGTLTFGAINIVSSAEINLRFSIVPKSPDVASMYNQIVQIDSTKLIVNMIADQTINGRALVGNKFQFTPNTF